MATDVFVAIGLFLLCRAFHWDTEEALPLEPHMVHAAVVQAPANRAYQRPAYDDPASAPGREE